MATLNELAGKLQSYIINSQLDARGSRGVKKSRYNNLKLKVNAALEYPNVIVCIGISEATYNIEDGTKTDGSLGPDEKYVYKWISNPYITPALMEIYTSMTDLVDLEEEQEELKEELEQELLKEGSAGESKIDDRPSRRSRKNLRKLMMPNLSAPQFEDEKNADGTTRRKSLSGLENAEDVLTPEYEEYSDESGLEVYKEDKFESLSEVAKESDFLNFIKSSFGFGKKKRKRGED